MCDPVLEYSHISTSKQTKQEEICKQKQRKNTGIGNIEGIRKYRLLREGL